MNSTSKLLFVFVFVLSLVNTFYGIDTKADLFELKQKIAILTKDAPTSSIQAPLGTVMVQHPTDAEIRITGLIWSREGGKITWAHLCDYDDGKSLWIRINSNDIPPSSRLWLLKDGTAEAYNPQGSDIPRCPAGK